MVERPIKKSERQAVAETKDIGEEVLETPHIADTSAAESQSPAEKKVPQPLVNQEKKGKGRGGKHKEQKSNKVPVNPALMRGPKPTKPKPPVKTATQEVSAEEPAAATEDEAS